MSVAEFLRTGMAEVHQAFVEDVSEVEPELLTWKPQPEANHIAFLFWHVSVGEDFSIHRRFQESRPIWVEERWYEQWGVDPRAIGTASRSADLLTPEQTEKIIHPLDGFLPYVRKVWTNTDDVLEGLDDDDLDREFTMKLPNGDEVTNTNGRLLRTLYTHLWWHLGEVRYIKGLQGWRFRI
jgi:hypothetical protein